MATAEHESYENHQVEQLGRAANIQALWAVEAGIRPDLFYEQLPQDVPVEKQRDIRDLVVCKLEEWGELITGLVQPTASQASRLLEVADVVVYSQQYVANVRQQTKPEQPTFSRPAAQRQRQEVVEHMAQTEILTLPNVQYTPAELQRILRVLQEAIIEDICQHFELVGYHPNGSTLAEIKRAHVEDAVVTGIQQITEAASQGVLTKALYTHIAKSMVAYADALPQRVRQDATEAALLPMFENISGAAQLIFAYSGITTLAMSLNVRGEVVDANTGEQRSIVGKNARNYPPQSTLPPGWTLKDVRAVRNQFPDSIIPDGFQLATDTPSEYMKQHPGKIGPHNEVRRFSENALR